MTEDHPRPAPASLLRVLGLVFGLAVVVGGVIGSGIMRAPGVVALGISSPPLILLIWAMGGGVAMLAAMPLVEAGSSVPMAGGPYPIAERAFGPTIGFFTGWLGLLQYTASNAFIAVVFGEYVHRLGFAPRLTTGALACGLILVVAAINWIGTRVSGASQSVASAIKGGVFLVLVVVLFVSPRAAPTAVAAHGLAAVGTIGAIVMAIRVIYQTYAGWDAAIYFSEEVERPDRNVARATFWGIGLVTILYVLVNAAVLHVLSPAAIAGSALAVGDAAKVSLGAVGDTVITAIGLFSLAAIVNLQIMAASRISFRMAADGALPPFLAAVAPGGTPRRCVALLTVLSMLIAAWGTYEGIVDIYLPWSIGPILIVCLAAIRLRIAEPELPRPWRMPLFPWIAIGAALIQASLLALAVWNEPVLGAWSAIIALAPVLVYRVFAKRWRPDPSPAP
ncbi:MAG TPA: APC family permease [Caulobacteraceae bacterium]|nr:APC family permease [Caulobacteraceae bacterium]